MYPELVASVVVVLLFSFTLGRALDLESIEQASLSKIDYASTMRRIHCVYPQYGDVVKRG